MVNDGNKKTLNEVAELAAGCLRKTKHEGNGNEVGGNKDMQKHPWINKVFKAEESHSLLPQMPCFTESVDSVIYKTLSGVAFADRVVIDLDDGRGLLVLMTSIAKFLSFCGCNFLIYEEMKLVCSFSCKLINMKICRIVRK